MGTSNTSPKRIKEFTRFLKRNHAYTHFKKNFDLKFFEAMSDEIDRGERVTMLTCISHCRARDFINYAFNWGLTEQGSSFWLSINNKWLRQIITIK